MTKRTKILVLIAGLAAVGYGVHRALPLSRQPKALHEFSVKTLELGSSIMEQGWLVSLDTEPVQIGMTGDILEILRSGTPVKKGDVIIRIDDTTARERLEDVKFNTHGAEQSKASSEADYVYVGCVEDNRLALLQKQLESARLEEEDARVGLKPEERRLLEIELEVAQLDLLDAEETLERQERLFNKGFISTAMLEPYQRKVATLEANEKEIRARIRLEEKGVPPERLLELEKNVERIQALLDRGQKAKARKLEYVQRQIDVAQARLEENLHDRMQVEDDLAAAEVRASKDGILSVRSHYELQVGRWSEYKPGDRASKYDHIADIVNPGNVKIEIMIHESDVDRVSVGTMVRIYLPAYPGCTFSGEVLEVGGVGRDRAHVAPSGYEYGRAGIAMFNASVSLKGNGTEFRPGMSAIVELITEDPRPRTVLSRRAVHKDDEGFYVLRKVGRRLRKTRIQGRVFNEEFFAVEEGLQEGEVVVVVAPEENA